MFIGCQLKGEEDEMCITGAAYIISDWKRIPKFPNAIRVYSCFKCGKDIIINPKTGRWIHKKK